MNICAHPCAHSASGIQLDLGSLAVSNTLLWKPAAQDSEDRSDSEGWVLVDDMQVGCVCIRQLHVLNMLILLRQDRLCQLRSFSSC